MVEKFHENLDELKNEVMRLGILAGNMLVKSISSLKEKNITLAEMVISQKNDLAEMDEEIEVEALQLLTLYQPMAKDLRIIGASIKMITYLTRIGRYGKDIANVAVSLANLEYNVPKLPTIFDMANIAGQMIDDVINAYNTTDLSLIQPDDFTKRDDRIDSMFFSLFRESISYMIEDPRKITAYANYIMVARYLERVGDLTCNMAEKIHYMVTGKRVEIN